MKAIIVRSFGPPEVMTLEDAPLPTPGPGQVLISIKAIGVNPVDTYIRAGFYGLKTPPYTPGFDAAGVVEAAGAGVARFSKGDRAYTSGSITGTYAEFALCAENQVHLLPANATYAQGASLGVPYATAYRALFHKADARPGETVLIHGATGGVGVAAVQLARAAGLTVIATGGTPRGRDLALMEGAHYAIDHRIEGHFDKVAELTKGAGVDVILEMLSNVNLGMDLKALARGGRVVVIGSRGTVEVDPRDAMGRDASVHGMSLFNAPEKDLQSIHAALYAGLENGTLEPVIGHEMALKEASKAHHAILEEPAYGKIILLP